MWPYILFLLQVTILTMFTLITLYSTIIPISLYVSIEVFCPTSHLMQPTFGLLELMLALDVDDQIHSVHTIH